MAEYDDLLNATASIIADYRAGEIAQPTAAHVGEWLAQFDECARLPLLRELRHVLKNTYISKSGVETFLSGLVTNAELTGGNPRDFWQSTKFLNIQTRGHSQTEFLSLFAIPLKSSTDLDLAQCGADQPTRFVYLDDGLYTGNTILNGLRTWLEDSAPIDATVHVITIALHKGGQYYAAGKLDDAAKAAGKGVRFQWWRLVELEDRRTYIDNSDVLRPKSIPDDECVKRYVSTLEHQPVRRNGDSVGGLKVFSSADGRNLLEQELLKKGAYIREASGQFPVYARPLGNMVLQTLGFGSTIVTYRNCPNNAPLAFWASDPWYPLFPRKTN